MEPCFCKHALDLLLRGTFKNWRCHGNAPLETAADLQQFLSVQPVNELPYFFIAIYVFKILLEVLFRGVLLKHLFYFPADTLGSPTQMGLKYLTYVHTGWYTQRVENDLYRTTVVHIRHILFRQDP